MSVLRRGPVSRISKSFLSKFITASSSKRPRHPEHVFPHVGEDQVGRDRGYLEEPGLAELALYVVLGVVRVTAEGLHGGVGRFPGSLGGEQECHIGLGAAGFVSIEQFGGPKAHQVRGFHAYVRPGYRELDALVLPYRTAEHLAFLGTPGCAVYEPLPVADALSGNQYALGVHPVEDVSKAFALLTDTAARRDAQVFEDELVGLVVYHHPPGFDGEAVAHGLAQVEEEHR